MDANAHVLDGSFTYQLRALSLELDIEEISHKTWWWFQPTNTHISGSKQIDTVWASWNLDTGGFKILPFSERDEEHLTMIFDVSTR